MRAEVIAGRVGSDDPDASLRVTRLHAALSADDAARSGVEECDERLELRHIRDVRRELRPGGVYGESRAIKRPVGAAQSGDRSGRETAALQSFDVDAVRP